MIHFIPILALMAVVLVLLHRAEFACDRRGILIFKPIASSLMTLTLLLSFTRAGCYRSDYTLALMAGMLLCFGGDMALMFMNSSKKAFRVGLVLFLLGHVAYSAVFTRFSGFHASDWVSAAVFAAAGSAVYVYLLPGLGDMKLPVLAYVIIISLMMNRAVSTFSGDYFSATQALLITAGAGLFYISDIILALGRFRHQWRYGRINLAFYYAGQVLIALSASFFC